MSGRHNNRRNGKGRKKTAPRPPLYERLAQSARAKGAAEVEAVVERFQQTITSRPKKAGKVTEKKTWLEEHKAKGEKPGFLRKLFNRKVG